MHDTMLKMYIKMQNLLAREDGQDLVEYALILSLLALAATASLPALGTAIAGVFTNIGGSLS